MSLLTGRNAAVKPTLGPLTNEDAVAHFQLLEELGIKPAKLQMSGFFLSEEKVKAFREGEKDATTAS